MGDEHPGDHYRGHPHGDDGLAGTPPMGWNSWNQVGCYGLTEGVVREAADEIVARGLAEVGYEYVVVDDCWQGGRDEDGVLFPDPERFPSGMAALADHVHGRGLRFGVYAVPGRETCANFYDGYPVRDIGSIGRERLDAQTFADWGVDYLKYDWCRADETDGLDRVEAFIAMRDALRATERPIVYGISEYGDREPWRWAGSIAHLWRTTHDIRASWESVNGIIQRQAGLERFSGPGAWNDPDMLQVGNGALTTAEQRTHVGMWAMLAAPLFLGTDLAALPGEVLGIVANPEVIGVDQDPLGRQASLVADRGGLQVWARALTEEAIAVALLNTTDQHAVISTGLTDVGAPAGTYLARDLWAQDYLSTVETDLTAEVGPHDVRLFRLLPVR